MRLPLLTPLLHLLRSHVSSGGTSWSPAARLVVPPQLQQSSTHLTSANSFADSSTDSRHGGCTAAEAHLAVPVAEQTSRRGLLVGAAALAAAVGTGSPPAEALTVAAVNGGSMINLPLENCGGSFCTLFAVEGQVFRGVLDTGSPFLTVAGSCTRRWGCFTGEGVPSGLPDTVEIFAGNAGPVSWKRGMLELGFLRDDLDDEGFIFSKVTFGVLSDDIVRRPGGVFLGLVKYNSQGIRPTFLGQTDLVAMRFDFPRRLLSLSRTPLLPQNCPRAVRLVDLRPLGDPVQHYAAEARGAATRAQPLFPPPPPPLAARKRDLYVLFDTGTTGLAVSRDLWEQETQFARENNLRPFRDVTVTLASEGGEDVVLSAQRPITTPVDLPWRGFNERAHVLVLGLDFLQGGTLSVDIDEGRLLWEDQGGQAGTV